MNSEKLQKIEELYHAAMELAPEERRPFLQNRCGADSDLRREVESLLAFENTSDNILDTPPAALADDLFFKHQEIDLAGKTISHYRIQKLIGKGGMGEVYLAEDTRLGRQVALKILPPELIERRDRLQRFEQEAQAASALNHPNILTIHEFGVENGLHFIVMEFVNGSVLSEKMAGERLPLSESLDIAAQAASALAEAHEAGIIHRDIKPENIMLRRDGYLKILDFGLAKLIQPEPAAKKSGSESETKVLLRTQPGMVMGTASYMSPEQARGWATDGRTDIWSLGVVMYELLTGQKAFPGETGSDVIAAVLSTEPVPISSYRNDVPAELDWIVAKALSKDVEGRYQTSKELLSDLTKIRKKLEFEGISRITGDSRRIITREDVPATAASGITGESRTGASRRGLYSTLALVVLAVICVATYFVFFASKNVDRIDSIAVLPFENSGGNADLTFIADGLSEALIDRLSQLPQLKVISRRSSFAFRGGELSATQVAAKLGVRAIVTGSVSQVGDELVIKVDVEDTVEDTHLTGLQFRRKVVDVVSIQNEIAQMTAEQLRLKLTSSQSKRLAQSGTDNSEAYRYYLNGLVELNGPQDVRGKALDYFERAVNLDPDFAAAHTEIAWVYWARANETSDPQKLMPKAKAATERALAIDPDLPKARVLQAMVNEYEFDWRGAEREYRRAIELSPSLDFARNNFAFFLSVMGRQDEALAELEEQRIRDPINRRLALLQKGIVLTQARRFDEALEAYQEAQAVEPAKDLPHFSLGYVYAGKGLLKDAVARYKKSIGLLGGEENYSQPLVYLAATYAKMPDKRSEAQAVLKKIEAMDDYKSPALLAIVYTALDDRDKAMQLLEQAYLKRDPLLRFIKTGYEYDGLRTDPRFVDLAKRIGFPE
jgi:serine/threonine protein kinase/tetratricopeptide (TPR) repeat protein